MTDELGFDAEDFETIQAAQEAGVTLGDYRHQNGPPEPDREVTAAECRHFREAMAENGVLCDLAERNDYAPSTVRHHVKGQCEHAVDAPPLGFDHDRQRWFVEG